MSRLSIGLPRAGGNIGEYEARAAVAFGPQKDRECGELNMMREALARLDRQASEHHQTFRTASLN
jgi:hypothetical protein